MTILNVLPLLLGINGSEWWIIALVVLILFGGKKIPELMKGLGKGIHEYKKGLSGEDIDDEKSSKNNDDK